MPQDTNRRDIAHSGAKPITTKDVKDSAHSTGSSLMPSSTSKARITKAKGSKKLSRAASTPHLSGATMPESEAKEKRNKLAYQRISVACGHCRRRKIRCIPSDEHPGTCATCIKLNKECIYAPVEQPAATETASAGNSKRNRAPSAPSKSAAPSTTSTTSSVASSSPQAPFTSQVESQEQTYSTFAVGPGELHSRFQPDDSLNSQGELHQSHYVYGNGGSGSAAWNPHPELSHHDPTFPGTNPAITASMYSRYDDTGTAIMYGSYPGPFPAAFLSNGPRPDNLWQQSHTPLPYQHAPGEDGFSAPVIPPGYQYQVGDQIDPNIASLPSQLHPQLDPAMTHGHMQDQTPHGLPTVPSQPMQWPSQTWPSQQTADGSHAYLIQRPPGGHALEAREPG